MAEADEDSTEILKDLENERDNEDENGKREHLVTDIKYTEKELVESYQITAESLTEEINSDDKVVLNVSGLAESKDPPDNNPKLSSKNLCDDSKITFPEKLWVHDTSQSVSFTSVKDNICKVNFGNEDGDIQELRDVEREISPELTKSSEKNQIHDTTVEKSVIIQNGECKHPVEIKVGNNDFSDLKKLSEEKSASTTCSPTQDDNEDSKKESEENEDFETEGEEEDSEDSPLVHTRRETETETEDSDHDFPTEGLLKELHFLNASCERPLAENNAALQTHKTPKKQRKLDFGNVLEDDTPTNIVNQRVSPRKRNRSSTPSPDKSLKLVAGSNCKKFKIPSTTPFKFQKSQEKVNVVTKQCDGETSDEESDDDGGLTIVAHEDIPQKRKGMTSPARSKKKVRGVEGDVPQEVIELIQSGIDEVLEEKAERTHLTAIHVKNIIKNVMTDENVLAMVRNTILGIHGKGAETSAVYEQTLTRAKTKELMEQQAAGVGSGNIWAGLSNSSAGGSTSLNPETQALATTDFPEEDEDEEYRPDVDEHFFSDDESLVSTGVGSETGSPMTPCTPSSYVHTTPGSFNSLNTPHSSRMSTPRNQRLMVLKTPSVQKKNVQRILDFDTVKSKEEVVSQRTRSKLPLTETPLECLEMAFKPPDVTNDMYETEVDNDDWKTFLIDFIHPLKNPEAGEDEEADPEYNILEDKEDALDLKEEMRGDRAVQISKKEINELMIELFDTLGKSEGTDALRVHLSQNNSQKEAKKSQFKTSQACQPDENKDDASSGAIWVDVLTAEFTKAQLQILQCQMIQHVQLLATSSLLCYGTSPLTYVANGCLELLEDLKKNAEESEFKESFFRPFNLEPALETLKNIQMKTADNPISDVQPESCTADLNPIVIEAILESSAFPYPRLLPIRMFKLQNTRGFKKAVFVKSEDMLIALGLERYLDPKYHQEKCRKSQPHQLLQALSMTVENILVGKTLSQATNRIKNIRCRANVAPNNPVLKYLETGHLDLPPAEIESSLPCVPCPVQNFPEASLKEPYRKMLQKRNAALKRMIQEVSLKAAMALEREEREAKFRGATTLPKSIQNILIIQSGGSGGGGGGQQMPESAATAQPFTAYSCIVDSSVIHDSPSVNLSQIQVVRMPNLPSSKCKAQTDSLKQRGYPSHSNQSTPGDSCKPNGTGDQSSVRTLKDNTENDSTNLVPSNSESTVVSYNDQESSVVFVDSVQDEECNRKNIGEASPPSPMKTSELESKPLKSNVELNDKNHDITQCISEDGENRVYDKAFNVDKEEDVSQKPGDDLDSGITSDNESLPDLNERPKESETFGEIRKKNYKPSCSSSVERIESGGLESVARTPPRAHYSTPPDTPSSYDMPSFLTTPGKSDENDGFVSSLHTPVISTSPSQSLTTPVKVIREIKQTDLSSILGKSEVELTNLSYDNGNNSAPAASHTSSASPCDTRGSLESSILVPLREGNKRTKYNEKDNLKDDGKTSFPGKCNLVIQNTALQDQIGTQERVSTLSQDQASTQSSSITLVTSVYQSPIFSAGVDEVSPLNLIHISPQKTKASYRKISPAKNFRSPIKTSPLKQVSPILRKYHKYSKKKRRLMSNKKLSPILPKISDKSNTEKRRLAPKVSKASIVHDSIRGRHPRRATGPESFLRGSKVTGDGDLLQLDDELMDGNTSLGSASNLSRPSTHVHQSEEEFEEYSLEDEDEEDEDEEEEDEEEEDLEAAQQREEHLAALLKASSTITLRRGGGGGDGFDKRLSSVEDLGQGERKLTKQQRRLQARITALSNVPDTVSQDKFMAQSYLMRVREALMGKDPVAFKEFLCMLNEFTETPGKSPIQLYTQLCEVLKDYPNLTEEFVSFLLPQQAMTLGKFAQYCAIHRMRDFLEKLELQFCKQPKYIQKIIRLLQSMHSDPKLNIEEVKAAMTPLLKYPHLVECFTQCFPSQPPPPSLQSDFEDISLENPGTPDSMERLVLHDEDSHTSPNQCVCPCHVSVSSPPTSNVVAQSTAANSGHHNHCRSCALRFSEGRIYLQCGKTLRPAKVTYQAEDVKKEEVDEKSSHGQATGGNVQTGIDCSETSTKVKSLGKGKSSHSKDPSDNVHVRSKENSNKMVSNSSSNNTVHVNNTSTLKSRTVVLSEERYAKEDICSQGEKIDIAVRIRGDNVDSVTEIVSSKNIDNTCCKNDCILEGKNHNVKKTCVNRSYEKTEDNLCTDPTYAKSASHSRTGLCQTNMRLLKGKVNTDSTSNSFGSKELSYLSSSTPKEVVNKNPVLRSCSNINNLQHFCTVGELLDQHVNVIDERNKPNTNAMIITDKAQLQNEHKATFCHVPIKISCETETQQNLNSNFILNKEPSSVLYSGGNKNSCRTYLKHCNLSRDSKSSSDSTSCSSSASFAKALVNQCTSNTEAKRLYRNFSESLDSSPGKLSSGSVSSVPATLTTSSSCNSVSWTKEEDRMILTVIQQKGVNDVAFQEIADALPSRDYNEVFDRFNVLVRLMMDETDVDDSMSVSSEDSTI
ncbi:GON-4-like protein isoform X1 [Procambarus clarkii]|uniref:GON-4-like protein isoform X1 n=1 Tax=Procambarus clarkii TaxID=6728 RepID=UPI003743B984